MKTQNYSNHIRKHPVYHYFIVPVSLLLIIASIANAIIAFNYNALLLLIVSVFIHLLAFLMREYAKMNQDRIICMELRLRYWQLTSKNFEEKEAVLTQSQFLALRFASDEEFLSFLNKANINSLSSNDIKQQIKNWKPDTMRV